MTSENTTRRRSSKTSGGLRAAARAAKPTAPEAIAEEDQAPAISETAEETPSVPSGFSDRALAVPAQAVVGQVAPEPKFQVVAGGRGQGGHMLALEDLPDPVEIADTTLPMSDGDNHVLMQSVRGIAQLSTAWEVAAKSCANVKSRQFHLRLGYLSMDDFLAEEAGGRLTRAQFYALCRAWETRTAFHAVYGSAGRLELEGSSSDPDDAEADGVVVAASTPPVLDQKAYEAFAPVRAKHGDEIMVSVFETVKEATGQEKPPVRTIKATVQRVAKVLPGTPADEIIEEARKAAAAHAPKPRTPKAGPVVASTTDQDRPGEVAALQQEVRRAQELEVSIEGLANVPARTHLSALLTEARAKGTGDDTRHAIDGLISRYRNIALDLMERGSQAKELADMLDTMRSG
ncbi:hypothetical protein [Streptomyces sp. NPDC056883]|uniref:hypothetical protein n=1 Tax=Streptomyces sp. NPDC056883 TaxID=3345959 RepID=UPI0036CE5AAB